MTPRCKALLGTMKHTRLQAFCLSHALLRKACMQADQLECLDSVESWRNEAVDLVNELRL